MALGKNIMAPKGMSGFWIIGATWKDNFNKTAFVSLYGFESKAHCDMEGSQYKERLDFNIGAVTYDYDRYFDVSILKEIGKCDLDQFYKFIKENVPDFSDAEDLIYTEEVLYGD